MEEMVETGRTIMIVAIVGLVIIWGSVAYHKFVQGSGGGQVSGGDDVSTFAATEGEESSASADQVAVSGGSSAQSGRSQRREGKKRKRKG